MISAEYNNLRTIKQSEVFGMSRNSRLNSQRGMTLVEIVIVVTILAVLMTFLVGQVRKNLDKAKHNETKLRMSQVGRALDQYYTDCSKMPASLDALITKDDCSNWGPESYLKSRKDLNDAWAHEFDYIPQASSYELKSLGNDGKEGGEGYAADITNAE
jgi:general secretion pathway protein G